MTFSKYDALFYFDDPVIYKTLKIYPAIMREYIPFHYCSQCLMLEKDSIPDAQIISMSYYEYLLYLYHIEKKVEPLGMFDSLLRMSLRKATDQEFKIIYRLREEDGVPIFVIEGEEYTPQDFDEIKTIIVEQNLLEPPDETIQKEIRDKMREAQRIKQERTGSKIATLEDQIISVAVYTGWDFEKIYQMTIRKFIKTLQRADLLLHYKIYLSASMSGFVEFKDKSVIKHWLSEVSTDKFDDLIEDQKIRGELDKLNNAL